MIYKKEKINWWEKKEGRMTWQEFFDLSLANACSRGSDELVDYCVNKGKIRVVEWDPRKPIPTKEIFEFR